MNDTHFKVLVASDGSEPVVGACELLVRLLPDDAHVRILTVLPFELFPWSLVEGAAFSDESARVIAVREAVEDATLDARLLFEKAGIDVEVAHRFGDAADEIFAEVEEWGPMLLALGRRRARGIERMLGSVSEHVVRRVGVPTLLVP